MRFEKNYMMVIRKNETTAYCRGCNKDIKTKMGTIIECTGYWNSHNGLVLCKDCLDKFIDALNKYKGVER